MSSSYSRQLLSFLEPCGVSRGQRKRSRFINCVGSSHTLSAPTGRLLDRVNCYGVLRPSSYPGTFLPPRIITCIPVFHGSRAEHRLIYSTASKSFRQGRPKMKSLVQINRIQIHRPDSYAISLGLVSRPMCRYGELRGGCADQSLKVVPFPSSHAVLTAARTTLYLSHQRSGYPTG